MPTEDQKSKFEKMTYFACIASSWAYMQYLRSRFNPYAANYGDLTDDEINSYKMLHRWWNGIGHGDRENIKRICKDMHLDVPTKHMRFIQTTQNEHNDKVVRAGGYL